MPNLDPLEILWLAIGLLGAVGAGKAVQTADARVRARKGKNGPRMFLLTTRRSTARMHMAAFSLWMTSGIWAVMQPEGDTSLRPGIIAVLVLGFIVEAAAILLTNYRDERLEHMLMEAARSSPHRRRDDVLDEEREERRDAQDAAREVRRDTADAKRERKDDRADVAREEIRGVSDVAREEIRDVSDEVREEQHAQRVLGGKDDHAKP